jgi:hypothetical protein
MKECVVSIMPRPKMNRSGVPTSGDNRSKVRPKLEVSVRNLDQKTRRRSEGTGNSASLMQGIATVSASTTSTLMWYSAAPANPHTSVNNSTVVTSTNFFVLHPLPGSLAGG